MKQVLLFCFTRALTLYIKGLALVAAAVLWPINVLMMSRLSEEALIQRERGGAGSVDERLSMDFVHPGQTGVSLGALSEPLCETPVLIGFSS